MNKALLVTAFAVAVIVSSFSYSYAKKTTLSKSDIDTYTKEYSYTVSIDTDRVSKQELLEILDYASSGSGKVSAYPVVLGSRVHINITYYNASDIKNDLKAVLRFEGVSIKKNPPVYRENALPECVDDNQACTIGGTPCCEATSTCNGKFPNTICQ